MTRTNILLVVIWVMTIRQGVAWFRRPHAYVYDEWPGQNPRFFTVSGAVAITIGILSLLLIILQIAPE